MSDLTDYEDREVELKEMIEQAIKEAEEATLDKSE